MVRVNCWMIGTFVTVFVSTISGQGRSMIHPVLLYSRPGNPGMKLRLTQKGLNYLNDIAAQTMNQLIPDMKIPNIERDMGKQGSLRFANIRTQSFKAADSYEIVLQPPSEVVWKMTNMNIEMIANINGRYVYGILPLDIHGEIDIAANGIDFSITSVLERASNGTAHVRALNCVARVRAVDMIIRGGGLVGGLINVFKGLALPQITTLLEKEMCKTAEAFVDEKANQQLTTVPTKIPLNSASSGKFSFLQKKLSDQPVIPRFSMKLRNELPAVHKFKVKLDAWIRTKRDLFTDLRNKIQKGLLLDYGLTEDPIVKASHIETINKGEVSWQGRGQTPFYPEPMFERLFVPMKMFYVLASDYLPNSMLYHAYKHGLLRFRVAPDNPEFGNFLRTTCDDGELFDVCLGDLLPPLANEFPGEKLELIFEARSPLRAPTMIFNRRGTVNMQAEGLLFIYLLREDGIRQIMSAEIEMQADTKLRIANKTVNGEVRLHRFQMTPRGTNLEGVDQALLTEFADTVGGILETIVNDYLKDGLPIPVIDGLTLRNPDLVIMNRFVRIETDVEVDPSLLRSFTENALTQLDFG